MAIRNIGAGPIVFETFGGRDADPEDAYLGEVETAGICIGIIGRKYGRPLKTRFSAATPAIVGDSELVAS